VSALGPRGFTVLSVAGIAGICLAVLGWTQRGTGLVSDLAAASPTPSASAAPSGHASAAPSAASSSPAAGPQLSSQPYASYAYQVWPGPLDGTEQLAMSGWTLTVTRQSGGITVKALQNGVAMASVSHFYPGGAKVYVLDSDLGDDQPGSADLNDTDDGLIVTNAQDQVLP